MKMKTRTLQLISFSTILFLITILIVKASVTKEKRGIIVDYLAIESIHIEKIDQAKLEYLNIIEVSKTQNFSDSITHSLTKRPFETFKDEKWIFGKDKDKLVSELKGMPGGVYKDILAFDVAIDKWCTSVKDDTIETFSNTVDGDEKFHALMKIRDDILTLKRKYATGVVNWLDILLLGVPLFASFAGIVGQIYAMLRQGNEDRGIQT